VIEFVFMLTRDDVTVSYALDVFADLRRTGLRYVGFKDVGPPVKVLREVTAAAHDAGMEVMLEVVSVSREDELCSLRAAGEIGVDWVLGGTHASDGVAILDGVKYCPFPGTIEGHPSVLKGSLEAIAEDAARLTALDGVHGLDLLAYRHASVDPIALTRAVVEAADGPVIAAGSVVSFEQIAALEAAGAWGFTIGSAIFAGQLPGAPSVAGQVSAVLAR
jgi:hypothetical protein